MAVFQTKKQPKLTKNEKIWQNPDRLMKFSAIWYVEASQQKKMLQKNYFSFSTFFSLLVAIKQPKLTKKEENWQNLNRLIKFFVIWYIDASQQKKMLQKNSFSNLAFLKFGI